MAEVRFDKRFKIGLRLGYYRNRNPDFLLVSLLYDFGAIFDRYNLFIILDFEPGRN